MKRLLCIVGSMGSGGAETFLMKIYRRLDKNQYQMDFAVASNEKAFYDDEIESYGGFIYHITPKTTSLIRNFNDIKKIVNENEYKYVLRVSQHSLSAVELLAAKLGGAKVCAYRSSNTETGGGVKNRLLHKIFKFLPIMLANVKIAPSSDSGEFMFGKTCMKRKQVLILHNAIDLNYYRYNSLERKKTREELNISEETFVIGHIGRFNYQKNHLFLLEIVKNIIKHHKNTKLILIGDGELSENIHQYTKKFKLDDNVIFAGIKKNIPAYLSSFDLVVFPSLFEGMPNTIIESQANGLHCIISDKITKEADITGSIEYISLDTKDIWEKKIINYIYSNERRKHDVRNDFISKGYDIDSVMKKFIEAIYEYR